MELNLQGSRTLPQFKAVDSRDRNFTKAKVARRPEQIEASIERYLFASSHSKILNDMPDCLAKRNPKRNSTLAAMI